MPLAKFRADSLKTVPVLKEQRTHTCIHSDLYIQGAFQKERISYSGTIFTRMSYRA